MTKHRFWNAVLVGLIVAQLVLYTAGCSQVTQRGNQARESRLVQASNETPTATPAPVIPKATGFVNDLAGALDDETKRTLEDRLRNFQHDHAVDFAIVIVNSTGDMSMDDYSLAIAKDWKVGSENGGLLLAIATQDRKWRIQLDRKLEKLITNDETLKIGELMVPELKQDNYRAALKKCTGAMITALTTKLKK